MMLEALVALAKREGLLDDTSYAKRVVHYQLRISDRGRPLALVPLGDEGKGMLMEVPVPPKKSVNIKSAFLVETAQYTLGLPKRGKGGKPDGKAIARAPKCLAAFAASVRAAASATDDEGLAAITRFLTCLEADPEGELARILALDRDREWTGDECIAFLLDEDGATYVHQRGNVHAYWAKQHVSLAREVSGDTRN